MNLIASEFKLHEKPKNAGKTCGPQKYTSRSDLIGNFDKLVSNID